MSDNVSDIDIKLTHKPIALSIPWPFRYYEHSTINKSINNKVNKNHKPVKDLFELLTWQQVSLAFLERNMTSMTKPIYDVRKGESILEISIGVWYTIPSLTCLINIISFVFIDGDDVSDLIYLAFFLYDQVWTFKFNWKSLMTIIAFCGIDRTI